MNNIELKVLEVKAPEVLFNDCEISVYLDRLLEKYKGLIFTDEMAKECKNTVTELNKLIKSVDSFRLKYKKELLSPISEFETKCKSLVEKIQNVQEPLKLQSEEFERKRKEERKKEVLIFIEEAFKITALQEKWREKLNFKEEWLNFSLSNSKCKQSIMIDVERLLSEQKSYYDKLEVINTKTELYSLKFGLEIPLIPENFYYMLDNYEGYEIDNKIYQIAEKNKEMQDIALEKIKKQAEENAQKEIDKIRIEEQQNVSNVMESIQAFIPLESEVIEKKHTLNLKLVATKNQFKALKEYLEASGIEYSKI